MSKWIHIDFWFRRMPLGKEQQEHLENIIKDMIVRLNPSRKFFLYEPVPHCFLALENVNVAKARRIVGDYRAKFIRKIEDSNCYHNPNKTA